VTALLSNRRFNMRKSRKRVLLPPLVRELLEKQRAAFRKQFSREPEPTDPIFFDPDCAYPRPLSQRQQDDVEQEILAAMVEVGINPAVVYAVKKTGRIVTAHNQQFLSKEELDEWQDAVKEYYSTIDARNIV